MYILIKDINGDDIVIKKNDIKRVYSTGVKTKRTIITFANKKENPSICVNCSVRTFFNTHQLGGKK
jgi:hypothetical protein